MSDLILHGGDTAQGDPIRLNPLSLAIAASTDEFDFMSNAFNLPGEAGSDVILRDLRTLQAVDTFGKFTYYDVSRM